MKTKHFLRTLALSGLIVSIFTISGCKERESNSSSLTQNNVSLTEDSSKPIEEVSSSLNSSENTLVDSSVESSSTISSLEENSSTEESSSSNNQNNIERDEGVIYKDATFVYDGNPHLHTVNTFNKAKGTNYQIKYYSDEACTSELTGFIEVGTYKAYAKLTDLNGLYEPFDENIE